MCGFAGVVAWDDRYRVDRDALRKMSARIAHRGPDGEGLYLNHEEEVTPDRPQVGLVHRRLAIIDPDPRANQPFTDGQGRWIVFNGEIYNFRGLRAELKKLKPDYEWRTDCDTEVLLVAYDVWGARCVDHLNGMFAFAVWDDSNAELFLARDRMGQKPLYYVFIETGCVAFASEVKALAPFDPNRRALCREGLVHYLQYGYRDPFGMTGGIEETAPNEIVRIYRTAEGQLAREWNWYFRRYVSGKSPVSVAQVRTGILRAVERQLVSDVPLGVFLSGGVDSSVIAASAKKFGPVWTYSIGFDDPRYDESRYARQVAAHLHTEHLEFRVTPKVAEDLPKLAEVFGEPFADSSALPTHYLARETRRHVKVALSGDGGDELFGGYDRYRAFRLARRFHGLRAMARVGRPLAAGHPKSTLTRIGRLLLSLEGTAAERYDRFARLFDNQTILRLIPEPDIEINDRAAYIYQGMRREFGDDVRTALAADRIMYLPEDLLTKVDRASMLHALEVRSPFMDHELVELAAGLTTDQLLKGGPKRMLREAFAADLPAWVFKRRKMGFAVPIGEWFRGELRPMLHDHLFAADSFAKQYFRTDTVRRLVEEHEAGRQDHSQRLYALLMLELWWCTR